LIERDDDASRRAGDLDDFMVGQQPELLRFGGRDREPEANLKKPPELRGNVGVEQERNHFAPSIRILDCSLFEPPEGGIRPIDPDYVPAY